LGSRATSQRLGVAVDGLQSNDVNEIAMQHAVRHLVRPGAHADEHARAGERREFRVANLRLLPIGQVYAKGLKWLPAKCVLDFLKPQGIGLAVRRRRSNAPDG